jgi:hypothetical protein
MLKRAMLWSIRWTLWIMMKSQERLWRRCTVVVVYVLLLAVFLNCAGLDHRWHQNHFLNILLLVCLLVYWPSMRGMRSLKSLEERSIAMYGVSFYRLTTEQARAVDRTREPGSKETYDREDEFAFAARRGSVEKAFAFLRPALLLFAAAYWAIYLWLPDGLVRRGLMDSPMVVTWLIAFMLTLPQVILLWTEPDEVSEPKVVAMEREV